jgi:hypothetical protein
MSTTTKQFVICVNNEGYSTSLEKRKIMSRFAIPLPRSMVSCG